MKEVAQKTQYPPVEKEKSLFTQQTIFLPAYGVWHGGLNTPGSQNIISSMAAPPHSALSGGNTNRIQNVF